MSLDYLVREGVNAKFDKKTLKRLQDIENLKENDKSCLMTIVDAFLRDAKTRQAYS